jgi:hypothetical protein
MHLTFAPQAQLLALFSLLSPALLPGQPRLEESVGIEEIRLKVFLDCTICDAAFLLEQLSYVHFVRDADAADVHVLITSNPSGGGRTHIFDFLGKRHFSNKTYKLDWQEGPAVSQDDRRKAIARKLELGLVPFWIETGLAREMDVSVRAPRRDQSARPRHDPWNRWVFTLSGGGAFNKESNRGHINVWTRIQANQATPEWRFRNHLYVRHEQRTFKKDEGDIVSRLERKFLESSAVKSIDDHWSAGLFSGVYQSTYDNLDFGFKLAPALEYSLYPYDEVNRRQVTLAYRVAYLYRDYETMTIFQKWNEELLHQTFELNARIRQPWGSLFAGVMGSHFFDDISKHRLQVDGQLNLRVSGGLSVQVGGDMALINDQRSLPAGAASLEDLLLAQRQVATSYRFSGSIGLTYTFGSIYNDVVNTRL